MSYVTSALLYVSEAEQLLIDAGLYERIVNSSITNSKNSIPQNFSKIPTAASAGGTKLFEGTVFAAGFNWTEPNIIVEHLDFINWYIDHRWIEACCIIEEERNGVHVWKNQNGSSKGIFVGPTAANKPPTSPVVSSSTNSEYQITLSVINQVRFDSLLRSQLKQALNI